MLPLLGTALLSMVGQLALKFAIAAGKKMFGKEGAQTDPETFPALLKKQLDPSSASAAVAPAAAAVTPPAQPPQGLQALAPSVVTDVPFTAAVSAYRRFEQMWPGRSMDTGLISSRQAP